MQTESPRPRGLLARVQARLRGDRYMVDAYPVAAVEPKPAATPAAAAPVPPTNARG